MTVLRDEFATADPELAEDMIRRVYLDQGLRISKGSGSFTFAHEAVELTGPSTLAINRLHHSATIRFEAEILDDTLFTDAPRSGTIYVEGGPGFDGLVAGPGETFLCPTGRLLSLVEDADIVVTTMSRSQVAAHAAARCGIAPETLRFTGLAPISPQAGRLWIATIAHVRDDILADAEVAAIPTVLDSAFQTLATTLLSSFPNTALDAVSDPLAPAPGHVSDAALRAVLEYLRDHAAEPVGPAEVAEVAGAPARDVDDALRRARNTTLAEQWWRARMTGAHQDLDEVDAAAGATVAEVATRWGFTNPATFAVAYTLFTGGRSPEETLRR